jgi:alkylhydroperoxidase family enzyme
MTDRPSKPRILPIEAVAVRARERAENSVVSPVNMQATLAHNRTVSHALGALAGMFFDENLLDPRLRELSILRMAWNVQCEYEFGQHTLYARSAGLRESEIYLTTRPLTDGDWSAQERAVLQMTDDLARDDCVSDATWTELEAHFDHEMIIALLAAPLCYRMAAGLFNSCGIELDDGIPRWPSPSDAGIGRVLPDTGRAL